MPEYLTLAQAAKTLPGRPHLSTLGIKLKTALVGGRRFTTAEWIDEFIQATTAAASGDTPNVRTARRRERDIATAEADLTAQGI